MHIQQNTITKQGDSAPDTPFLLRGKITECWTSGLKKEWREVEGF